MKRIAPTLVILALSVVTSARSFQFQQSDAVKGKKSAYLFFSPKLICESGDLQTNWSRDGKYLLVRRVNTEPTAIDIRNALKNPQLVQQKPPSSQLIIYSLDTETSRVVHEYDASKSVISLPQFVGKSGMVAFVEQLEDGASRLALVEPGGRKLSRVVSTSHVQLVCSSLRSEVILQTENEFWLLDSQLEVRKKFPRIGNLIGYGPKEESLEYFVISAPVSPSKQSSITPGLIDIKTGKMREISIAERNALNQAASDASPHLDEFDGVAIVSSAISPILKDAMAVLAVVENRPVLIAGDGRNPMVNADHTAVSYVTKAGVMVRPIVEVPIELYENGITAAERAKILSEAKQCALAYIIYAADYDNVVPGADSNWSKLLGPYLKNDSLLNGFVITFNGGNLGDVSSPAETVMGYKLGPGGRAVAYLDGHVKWQKN